VGVTQPDHKGLGDYLRYTDQLDFAEQMIEGSDAIGGQLCLVSFYAKLCYKSLVLGKNANVTRVRDIEDNLKSIVQSGHGSVFEHVWLNFVTTDCSRVFTHELVRHRVGTAFSQTSGRYVAIDKIDLVIPPELAAVTEECEAFAESAASQLRAMREKLITEGMDFAQKKKITSAIRRLAPNGQTNEIGWSANVRSLRHMIEMRTSRHAEWEIRVVFSEVASMIQERWPLMLHGGERSQVDGLDEWTMLKV
jgi:thymidylate synthase (FAD)